MPAEHIYDLIVIGAGPAGLSAGIYAGRATLDTLILEAEHVGGQVTTTMTIYNYPAVGEVRGDQLMNKMRIQAEQFGATIKRDGVTSVDLQGEIKKVTTQSGHTYQARTVILATGAHPKRAGFPGERQFMGRGVSNCATCDGELYSGKEIFVVGGGFAAAEEADYLTRYAKHVTILIRKDKFRCPVSAAKQAIENPKITILYNTEVKEARGDHVLRELTLVNNKTGKESTYKPTEKEGTFGLFVYVGTTPETAFFKDQVKLSDGGYVITDEHAATNVPGVYAAGDVVDKNLRQIVTAAGDGATAATNAEEYVTEEKRRLGLPLASQAKPAPKAVPKSDDTDENNRTVGETSRLDHQAKPSAPHTGAWFTPEAREQLEGIFERLTAPVSMRLGLDDSELSQELLSFTKELASMSPMLSVEETQMSGLEYAPQMRLYVAGKNTGLYYAGIPSGHEINSLVIGIYNVGSAGQQIDKDLELRIKRLPAAEIKVGVSLTCHFCPDVVTACQKIAALNPNITAMMIDLQHFPELRESREIMSVPATIINDGPVLFGSQSLEDLVDAVEHAI